MRKKNVHIIYNAISPGRAVMITIPQCLYTREIVSFIDDQITFNDTRSSSDLDEREIEHFTGMCIRAFGCDCEIVLTSEIKSRLATILISRPDTENEIDLVDLLRKSACELYTHYLDEMIAQERMGRDHDKHYANGKHVISDKITGESIWI